MAINKLHHPASPSAARLIAAALAFGLGLAAFGNGSLAAEPDPNLPAVKAVCGRCHGEAQFLDKPRSWERWNDVFRQMTRLGATGTDQQLEQVTTYFLDHLTALNVNTATAEEFVWVLGVSDEVAENLIASRQRQPFKSLPQLAGIPGVKRETLERLKGRIEF